LLADVKLRIVLRKRSKIEIKTIRLFGEFGHHLHMFLQANSLGIGGSTCAFCLHFGSCGGIHGIQGTSDRKVGDHAADAAWDFWAAQTGDGTNHKRQASNRGRKLRPRGGSAGRLIQRCLLRSMIDGFARAARPSTAMVRQDVQKAFLPYLPKEMSWPSLPSCRAGQFQH